MKTKKMSLKNIKDVLSRDEMKKIMAGSGSGCGGCWDSSHSNWAYCLANYGGFACYCTYHSTAPFSMCGQ